jgi:NAD(P)H dehydrogenase (quinone)
VILVTGAIGQVGYHLLEALADMGAEVTAMVRVPAKAVDLPGTSQHLVATLDRPPSADVLRAFDPVFLLSPAHEGQVELELIFIDALLAAGHSPHVVKIAADGFQDPACEVRFMRNHREIAAHLDAAGLPVKLFEWIRNGGADSVTSQVRDLAGADPRAIEDWLSAERSAFLGPTT